MAKKQVEKTDDKYAAAGVAAVKKALAENGKVHVTPHFDDIDIIVAALLRYVANPDAFPLEEEPAPDPEPAPAAES